jgi:hypothetical protein
MSGGAGKPNWEEVEHVMAAFLELPEQQRPAYLARQPASIRAEVESLVAAYRGAGRFLGSETGKPIAAVDLLDKMRLMLAAAGSENLAARTRLYSESVADVPDFAVNAGTQLGSYRIESVIGKGGDAEAFPLVCFLSADAPVPVPGPPSAKQCSPAAPQQRLRASPWADISTLLANID